MNKRVKKSVKRKKKLGKKTVIIGEIPVEGLIMLCIAAFGVLIAGGLFFTDHRPYPVPPTPPNLNPVCCDSGNGNACQPIVDATHPVLTYNSPTKGAVQYGLLKSNVSM